MKRYVLAANALVRYYRRTPGYDTARELVEKAEHGQVALAISVVNPADPVTADPEFGKLGKALKLPALPRHAG